MNRLKIFIAVLASAALAQGCNEDIIDPGITAAIKIEAIGSDTSSIKVLLTPDERTASFEYAIGDDTDYNHFIDKTLEFIEQAEGNTPVEKEFTGLRPNTIYSIYAQAYTKDGNSAGISVLRVSTKDNKFKVSTQYISDVSAGFKLAFTPEYESCIYHMGTPEDKDAFMNEEIGESVSEIDRGYEMIHYFDLEPETEYVFYAAGVDRMGIRTDLVEIPFKTQASSECPNVTVETDIDIYQGSYTITPNANASRIIGLIRADKLIGMSNDLVLFLESWAEYGTDGTKEAIGGEPLSMTFTTPELQTSKQLFLYVVIYDNDGNLSGMKLFEYSTPAPDSSLEIPNPASIEVTNISSSGAVYTISADDTAFGYIYGTLTKEWYDEAIAGDSYYEYYIHDFLFGRIGTDIYFHYGNSQTNYAELAAEDLIHDYYAVAITMNANGPQEGGWGPISLEAYSTPEN